MSIKVGILIDQTGPGAEGKTAIDGIKAGIGLVAKSGYNVTYVTADTGTNPTTTTSVAQRLVEREHVTVVMGYSAVLFAAAPYLAAHKVPVIGVAQDGPEWIANDNMFSVIGSAHQELVSTVYAEFFKTQGVKNVGALGYGIAPNSALAAKGIGVSAEAEGMKAAYINANFPFGSTDVQPVALAMKDAQVDGFVSATATPTALNLVKALKNINALPKATVLLTGYGNETLNGGPATTEASKGVYYPISYEPVEMNTPATQQFQAARKAVGLTGSPNYAEYFGYAGILLLQEALKVTGPNPTQKGIIDALSKNHNFTAGGLTGSVHYDINDRVNQATGPQNCLWYSQFDGTKFVPVKDASPVCGKVLPQKVTLNG